MARLMLCWELGGGIGHATPLAQLAAALLQRGHQVHLVWKDLSVAHQLLPQLLDHPQLHLWQAPIWLAHLHGHPDPASYPELLLRAGYLEPQRLLGCALGWRQLIDAVRPDLLLAEYAPTAMLAARASATRCAAFGSGFVVPPACAPMPPFRDWEPVAAPRLADAEARALAGCNELLGALGAPRLTALHDLFRIEADLLLGWPELDHYRGRRGAAGLRALGWPAWPAIGTAPRWPAGRVAARPRIFGYLRCEHPALAAILATLRSGRWDCLLYLADLPDADAEAGSSASLRIVNRPVDLSAALAQADLLLGYGGVGTVHAALQAGLPLVLLPTHAEQLLLARRVASLGVGVMLWPDEVGAALAKAIDAVAGSPGFGIAARALADRHAADAAGATVIESLVARCEMLVAQR